MRQLTRLYIIINECRKIPSNVDYEFDIDLQIDIEIWIDIEIIEVLGVQIFK